MERMVARILGLNRCQSRLMRLTRWLLRSVTRCVRLVRCKAANANSMSRRRNDSGRRLRKKQRAGVRRGVQAVSNRCSRPVRRRRPSLACYVAMVMRGRRRIGHYRGRGSQLRSGCHPPTLASMHAGQEIKVYTSLNVSQDAITLFGLARWPRNACSCNCRRSWHRTESRAIVAVHFASRSTCRRAVADGDATAFAKAPGLGRRRRQKIILELKGSMVLEPR